jgi:hypothetical protein
MKNDRSGIGEKKRLRKGDKLPTVSLKPCSEAGHSVLSRSRGPRVFVAVHELGCRTCIRYVQQVGHIQDEIASWDGHVAVVGQECNRASPAALAALGVAVLEDPDHLLADGNLSVVIADEWGEIYFASESENLHGAISPAEVLEWVKFVAIQCPECEAPEGEWRNL